MKRVVVTGLGLISSLGIGLEESWKKLIAGETGIDLITSYDTTDQPVRIAGEVKGFEPTNYVIEKKEVKKLARNTQFALAATKMALEDANFKIDETNFTMLDTCLFALVSVIDEFETTLLSSTVATCFGKEDWSTNISPRHRPTAIMTATEAER